MTGRELLQQRRSDICKLAGQHGAGNIRIFGSVVRNEYTERSDIDMLVTMEKGRSLLDLIALEYALEDLFHCEVDVLTDDALSPYIKDRILREAIPL